MTVYTRLAAMAVVAMLVTPIADAVPARRDDGDRTVSERQYLLARVGRDVA